MNDRDVEDTRQPKEPATHAHCEYCGNWEEIGFMTDIGNDKWLCGDCEKTFISEEQNEWERRRGGCDA